MPSESSATLEQSLIATAVAIVAIGFVVYLFSLRLRSITSTSAVGKGRLFLFLTSLLTIIIFIVAANNCLGSNSGDVSSDISLIALLSFILVQLLPVGSRLWRVLGRSFQSEDTGVVEERERDVNMANWIYAGFLFPSSLLCATAWYLAGCKIPNFWGVSVKWVLGNVALLISLLIVAGSIYVLHRMMVQNDKDHLGIGNALRVERFGALCFFFSVFLNLTFMLGFSLALHDAGYKEIEPRKVALFSSQFYDPSLDRILKIVPSSPGESSGNAVPAVVASKDGKNTDSVELSQSDVFIFFHGNPRVANDFTDIALLDSGSICANRPISPDVDPGVKVELFRSSWNTTEKNRLRAYVEAISDTDLITFDIWASTTVDRPVPLGVSNDSIADGRAARTCHEIRSIDQARGGNALICQYMSVSTGVLPKPVERRDFDRIESYLEKCEVSMSYEAINSLLLRSTISHANAGVDYLRRAGELQEEMSLNLKEIARVSSGITRNVDAIRDDMHKNLIERLNKPRELHLLDYMYFTIYTITTTGYGDIVPLSGFSKFVCSFANIAEVFYLAMFFNIMIARID